MVEDNILELQKMADQLRLDVVEMMGVGKTGHLGGSCSLADIISVLYFYKMKHDPKNPKHKSRDRFLLSKGHAALIQYAALAECGYFEKEELKTLKKYGSNLQGHPDMLKLAGIEANTGSLGQGVSLAAGMAAGLKMDKLESKVYVIVGDGELAEGQLWEAFMSATNYKLNNLRVIIDCNGLQATGKNKERFPITSLDKKLEAFGFEVMNVDGHNIKELIEIFHRADDIKGKPVAIIAETVKGKGISFAENVVGFHNGLLTPEQYEEAVMSLKGKVGE